MLTRVSLVLQSIIPLHSWEKESPQHMTSDWFIILLAACFTPALTFLVCWNLHNWLCVSVCFSAIGRWCFFSPFPTWLCLNECILCHICVGCHHCQIVPRGEIKLSRKTQWPSNVNGWQFIQLWKMSIRVVICLWFLFSLFFWLCLSLSYMSCSLFPSYCQPPFCELLQALFSFSLRLHLPISVSIWVIFLSCT